MKAPPATITGTSHWLRERQADYFVANMMGLASLLDRDLIGFDPTTQMLTGCVNVIHVGPPSRRLLQYSYDIILDEIGSTCGRVVWGCEQSRFCDRHCGRRAFSIRVLHYRRTYRGSRAFRKRRLDQLRIEAGPFRLQSRGDFPIGLAIGRGKWVTPQEIVGPRSVVYQQMCGLSCIDEG